MPAPYINTPRTNDATYLTDQLDGLSPEKSFAAPTENGDLVAQMKKARAKGMNLKTPRVGSRDALRLLPNGNQAKPEFTPLMRSVTKTNMARRLSARRPTGAETPGYLRNSHAGGATPALPRMEEESNLTGISAGRVDDFTPIPQNISSSVQSTPLAQLPGRDAVISDGNLMTLREQENIIDKIEKENFGLKMKIHFLEEAIAKRGGEFNQAALKENTDLKVTRITMQRELHKFKKTLAQAERDAEIYRQQLEEYRERVRRKQMDESIRIEVESVRSELKVKDAEIAELQSKHNSLKSKSASEVEKLRDEIVDLQAELREKDRHVEDKEDEIDAIKLNFKKESNVTAELEDELESARQQMKELKDDLNRISREAKEAKEAQEDAEIEKRRAEQDLDELRDEMANKSFTTKGLSRQLEERVDRLEDENEELRSKNTSMRSELDEKVQSERKLQERLREAERDSTADTRHLQQELEASQQQHETFERKFNNAQRHLESLEREMQVKADEKDLLQTRHDALTTESADLQKDLTKLQQAIKSSQVALEQERQQALQNDNFLRTQHKTDIDILNEQIDTLHREVNAKEKSHEADQDEWDSQKRALEALSKRAEEKATGLQRTVDKLQDAQGTLSGREMRLQEALESEKQRHLQEEKVLSTQIQELNQDLANKRAASDDNRSELNNAKEELRISIREQAALKEKVAELEDEIEVLQADIEQEHEFVQQLQNKSSQAADSQMVKLRKEKQDLQESLASANAELQTVKRAVQAVETERDDLEVKLEKAQQSNDDTFDGQQEKRELRRVKQKLENDVEKLRLERDNLATANDNLEAEINAEIDRANAEEHQLQTEIDQLKARQAQSTESRDKELVASKNKIKRLEDRIAGLEDQLGDQSRKISSPSADLSGLRHDLAEARKSESATAKRETELKSSNRDLKMKINDLERDLHEARLAQLKSRSPSATPPPSHSKELVQLRKELVDARAELKVLQSDNRNLKKQARRVSVEDTERADLEILVKNSSKEAKSLAALLAQREDELDQMQAQLQRIREERNDARQQSLNGNHYVAQISEFKAHIQRLRAERDASKEAAAYPSSSEKQASEMKDQLQRLREERTKANQKAEAVEQELDILQSRYESILEKLSTGRYGKDDIREKEMKGLLKEITWLKAKCRREERLRRDLAWSKAFLEQGEAMRSQCNQVDLRILREMGVNVERKKYEKKLRPIQKFRAGVFTIIAAIRMSNLEEQWRDAKLIGENLRVMKQRQARQG